MSSTLTASIHHRWGRWPSFSICKEVCKGAVSYLCHFRRTSLELKTPSGSVAFGFLRSFLEFIWSFLKTPTFWMAWSGYQHSSISYSQCSLQLQILSWSHLLETTLPCTKTENISWKHSAIMNLVKRTKSASWIFIEDWYQYKIKYGRCGKMETLATLLGHHVYKSGDK